MNRLVLIRHLMLTGVCLMSFFSGSVLSNESVLSNDKILIPSVNNEHNNTKSETQASQEIQAVPVQNTANASNTPMQSIQNETVTINTGTTEPKPSRLRDLAGKRRNETIILSNPRPLANVQIGVKGIRGLEQYAQILEFLKTLPDMKEVEVQQISPEQTIFNLSTSLNRKVLMEYLVKGPIQLDNEPQNGVENTKVLEGSQESQKNSDMLQYRVSMLAKPMGSS